MMLLFVYLAGIAATVALVARGLAAIFSSRTRRDVAQHPFLHIGVAVFVLAFWLSPWGSAVGWISGHFDSWTHRWRLSHAPKDVPFRDRVAFARIMQDRYGIFCPPLQSCVRSGNDIAYGRAHDAVLAAAILRHFGFDVFDDCKQAAYYETQK